MYSQEVQIGTIIVSYHSDALTIEMVQDQLSKIKNEQIIVIVNNGATFNSSKQIAKAIDGKVITDFTKSEISPSNCYVIHNEENSGFAKGNNIGVEFLTTHFKIDYLLFTNNDIQIIDNNVVEQLVSKMQKCPQIGIIGPKVIGLDGKCQSPDNYVPFWDEILWMTWGRFLKIKSAKTFNRDVAPSGFYYRVMGSFFMTRYEDFINCGKMDEKTFLFGEEVILSERMKKINKKVYYLSSTAVLHAHGQTISKHVNLTRGAKIMYNSLLYYFKYYRNVNNVDILLSKFVFYPYIYMQHFFRLLKRIFFNT